MPKIGCDHRTKIDIKENLKSCVYPSPVKWLRGFFDSQMVIVDSFHGMVFSIIFNKPFWVIGNSGRGLSRFESLLGMFNLSDRLIEISDFNMNKLNASICWNNVNSILKRESKKSIEVIKSALNK